MASARRVAVAAVFVVIVYGIALDFWDRHEPIGIDFHTYLAAARVGLTYGWSRIYNQDLVAVEQTSLVSSQVAQPFLSPPTVAWIVAPLFPLPYWVAFYLWYAFTFIALALALAWSSTSRGMPRWVAVAGALTPWWVVHGMHVGQVVPLVAVGVVLAWRLLREQRDVAAGVVLSLLLLKPNTAFLVPLALLAAGRTKAFAAWAAAAAVIGVAALASLGVDGIQAYLSQVTGELPPGANNVTLEGAFGVAGATSFALRGAIVIVALVSAYRLRQWPGLVLAMAVVGSLLVTPYIHASDLVLFAAVGWILWEEHPRTVWRIALVVGWLIGSPFLALTDYEPTLKQWPLLELSMFLPLAVLAFVGWTAQARPDRARALTGEADLRTQGPA